LGQDHSVAALGGLEEDSDGPERDSVASAGDSLGSFSIINSVLRGTLEPHAKVPADARFFYTLEVALPNLCYDFYMIVSALPDANPNHWRLGIFYFNSQDRRLFVPKRRGFGWTLNFANIWAWLLVGLIIFVLIARLLNRGVRGRV